MIGNPPVNDCLNNGKEEKIIPVCPLCINSHYCQCAIEHDGGEDEKHKVTEGDNPADGKISMQKVLTVRTAVLTVNVDDANHCQQDTPNPS